MPADTIAIDVAILLPVAVAGLVRDLNTRIRARNPAGFAFDTTHLPHITLLQQCVAARELEPCLLTVEQVVGQVRPLELEATRLEARRSSGWLTIAPNAALQDLHEALLAALSPFAGAEVDESAFFVDDERPREADLTWVREYRAQSSGERFAPHVSLGVGPPVGEPFSPHRFIASEIAVCQLGRHCTCRKVLADWTLG